MPDVLNWQGLLGLWLIACCTTIWAFDWLLGYNQRRYGHYDEGVNTCCDSTPRER